MKNAIVSRAVCALCLVTIAVAGCGGDDESPRPPEGEPGFEVEPTSGLTTTESGGQATFEVVLTGEPIADVTVAVSSSDEGEGTVSPSTLTFTIDNWNAPQEVTITGVDDEVADGDASYEILLAEASSEDDRYEGLDPDDVSVTNTDDESPGVTVDPVEGLTTTEDGGTDTFTVVLNAQPSADVTIAVMSDDDTEGTADPENLTFTPDNWNAPQEVTVTGLDDEIEDGDVVYDVMLGDTVSDDDGYSGLDVPDVTVTNIDDESAAIIVDPVDGLTTGEDGTSDTFTVVLTSEPTADVTIALSSSDTDEGTVAPASLTFTSDNYDAPQTVTVTGVDDDLEDGNQVYQVVTGAASSSDSGYDGLDPDDVEVTNTDDDSAGVTVDPTTGLTTTEAGGTDTFTVVLNSEPTADVIIPLSSADTGEGTVSPASLTFTTANWNAPQTATVTGVDDAVEDGDQVYMITVGAASSTDADYDGEDGTDVEVTNDDDDSAGITVDPTSGLSVNEDGTTDTFTIVLDAAPTADVTIDLTSSDTGEGTVTPASVTFTPANWDAPQTVTVTGVDDAVEDGDQVFNIQTAPALSTDSNYATLNADDVSVTNVDNDSAGVTLSATSGLVTTEGGGTDTFTIVLNSQPTADVTIGLSSDDTGEGTVSPASVTFTSVNWNAPQTVTLTGVDDSLADGNQPYTIITADAASSDGEYDGLVIPNVAATNNDNDTPGITVTPTSGLVTTEAGGTDSFEVVLDTQPTADVTITLASDDTGEGTASPMTLTFTPTNWNAPQEVTVTGVADAVFDGDQVYTIVLDAASSADTDYDGIDPADVVVTNDDNDPGVTVNPTDGLTTSEPGGTAAFTVVLNTMPSANVTISVASSDTGEGVASPSNLTFTPTNWDAPQTVTVTGVQDAVADGAQPYTIVTGSTVSTDASYNALTVADVSVTNVDDDSAGITLSTTGTLVVDESGTTNSFTIVLNSRPTANVTIALSSTDTGEGTVSPMSLTFTPTNWSAPRTVTVTGVDDAVADGNQAWFVDTGAAVSGDADYDGMDAPNVRIATRDDETAGFVVEPLDLVTREDGSLTPTYGIRLTSEPTADVTVTISSADTSEGSVSPASLTFTPANWASFQNVTVTGEEDALADGDQVFSVVNEPASSTDSGYDGLDPADVSVTNVDNDSAGITVNPTSGLTTTEAGGTATFSVVLNSQPTADVTIGLSSDDTSEGTASPSSLTFTSTNWSSPQTVTVTGVDDSVEDGDQVYRIVTAAATSSDGGYSGRNAPDVSVTNQDDETAGFTVTPSSGLSVTEAGTTDTFTIVLNSQPTASVTVTLSSSDTSEGTVSPSSVTFTDTNWNAPQTVTVRGVDDFVADGDMTWTAVTGAASSADSNYDGVNPPDPSVVTEDDETPGVTVSPTSGLTTSEDGTTTDTFTIVLDSQPAADVTIGVASSDAGEGDVTPMGVTFTPTNWNAPQTITVLGVDDAVADGDAVWTAVTTTTASADMDYSGLTVADVSVTNVDDETAGIQVSRLSGLVTNEGGVFDTFTVRLTSQPLGSVTIPVASDDTSEGTASPTSLTFTTTNWDTPQTVTVTGVDDFVADGNQVYQVDLEAATSTDPAYDGMVGPSVSATNLDDETPGITVTPTSGLITTEGGGTDTFDVVLNSQPTAGVTISLMGNPGEGTLSDTTLSFDSTDWDTPQTVTVTGVDDSVMDGNQLYFVIGDPSGSADADYAALSNFDVEVTNVDND